MNEFIDTYSDDLLYLIDFRDSHLTHPGKRTSEQLMYGSLCRIFCAFMIGSIEAMIENWKDRDSNGILDSYFLKGSNESRINSLQNSFIENNIAVEESILNEYLAIKYVRNSIIHSGWNESQKEFIQEMGFPLDTRELNEIHLEKMYKVNIEMMKYIASVGMPSFHNLNLNSKLPTVKRYFTKKEFIGFLWHNMEQMEYIWKDDERTEITAETKFNWNLFKSLVIQDNIELSKLNSNFEILKKLVDNKNYSKIPIGYLNISNISDFESLDINFQNELSKMLDVNKEETKRIIIAINQGQKSYDIIRNKPVGCNYLK